MQTIRPNYRPNNLVSFYFKTFQPCKSCTTRLPFEIFCSFILETNVERIVNPSKHLYKYISLTTIVQQNLLTRVISSTGARRQFQSSSNNSIRMRNRNKPCRVTNPIKKNKKYSHYQRNHQHDKFHR